MPRPDTLETIEKLIGFDTTSHRSNRKLIDWVSEKLARNGASCRLTWDESQQKANLLASFGPLHIPGYILSAHTDTVPVDGQSWTSPPYTAAIRSERLYGRGACDMKGFAGLAIAIASRVDVASLRKPLHVALSCDEEIGCVGVRALIADMFSQYPRPEGCLVGEPTRMVPVVAHKGKTSFRIHLQGQAAHASEAPRYASALEGLGRVITALYDLAKLQCATADPDSGFDLPFSTVNIGCASGGTAINIVAAAASCDVEVRHLPGFEPQALIDEALHNAGLQCERLSITCETLGSYPGLNQDMSDGFIRSAIALSPYPAAAAQRVAFGTEAGLYQQAGIPTLVCGPGSIDQAHKPDEYVSLKDLDSCEVMLEKLLGEVCKARFSASTHLGQIA